MTVGEMRGLLAYFPDHYKLDVFFESPEMGDLSAEIEGLFLMPNTKVVGVELATNLLPDDL